MNQLADEILEDDLEHSNNKLPQFLNVLTILTFVGSGINLIAAIYYLATIEQQKQSIAMMESMSNSNPFMDDSLADSLKIMLEHIYLMQGSAIAIAIACIFGAVMMRKLKKIGFFIYTFASVLSIVIPLAVIGYGFLGMMILLGSVITIAFIIMYSVNYKYLK